MKPYAEKLYKSKEWQKVRTEYIKSVGGLCEDCLAKGIYKPGVIVHHIEHVTPQNVFDPEIALNKNNLKLLCRDCHAAEHTAKEQRYYVNKETGAVTIKD